MTVIKVIIVYSVKYVLHLVDKISEIREIFLSKFHGTQKYFVY